MISTAAQAFKPIKPLCGSAYYKVLYIRYIFTTSINVNYTAVIYIEKGEYLSKVAP